MTKQFAIGEAFTVVVADIHLGSTEFVQAEFTGPVEDESALRFVLQAREAPWHPDGGRGKCVVGGHIPAVASPGTYRLSRLTVQQDVGPGWAQEWPATQLPDVSFEVVGPRA
jgi:hypothetical protein